MRPAVLICSVLLLLGVSICRADSDEECDCSRYRGRGGGGDFRVDLLRTRADNNDVEINRLFNSAYDLEKKLDSLKDGPDVAELRARVDALTGNDCGEGEFECADRGGCVSPLQVCDGDFDCSDHSDESEDTCRILTSEGSSWGAAISHNECFRKAANHVRVVIARAERSDILPSQVAIEVTTFLYTNDGDISLGKAEGFYSYGTKTASFRAIDGDILDLKCHFNGHDDDSCHGVIYQGLSEEPCGEIVFVRE